MESLVPIEVIEVIRRSTQGITKPFICRGSNGKIYFVKGKGAGRRSLIAEWLAGHLAILLKIPIAPFSLVSIPEELLSGNPLLDLSDLGCGYAFGSKECSVTELTYSRIPQVPLDLQQKVLAFDWWINNEDRTLTDLGGNPNLFWSETNQQLVVIDHNQAFDPDFDAYSFVSKHVFGAQWAEITQCSILQASLSLEMQQALSEWKSLVESVPQDWWYLDDELTLPTKIDTAQMLRHLNKVFQNDFWRLP